MKSGTCPKCKSKNVVMSPGEYGGVGPGLQMMVMGDGTGMSSTKYWQTYLCLDCGYFENYITDRKILDAIQSNLAKSNWKKV
jgi:predicted nucleic-acid-binding Zn-ribbon protein